MILSVENSSNDQPFDCQTAPAKKLTEARSLYHQGASCSWNQSSLLLLLRALYKLTKIDNFEPNSI
jgi:hypothetical protein